MLGLQIAGAGLKSVLKRSCAVDAAVCLGRLAAQYAERRRRPVAILREIWPKLTQLDQRPRDHHARCRPDPTVSPTSAPRGQGLAERVPIASADADVQIAV